MREQLMLTVIKFIALVVGVLAAGVALNDIGSDETREVAVWLTVICVGVIVGTSIIRRH